MEYKYEKFENEKQLVNFLNENKIKKENIIGVFPREGEYAGKISLIYMGEKTYNYYEE